MSRCAALIISLVVLLSSACAHRPSSTGEGERTALQQREREFLAALSARNFEQTTAYFAEDAVLHVANLSPLQGRGAIAQFYGNVFRFVRASEARLRRGCASRAALTWRIVRRE